MSRLFDPLTLRETVLPNRAWVAPMCQYSASDGLVVAEAPAVVAEGRITSRDAGLYTDEHVAAWRRITDFVHERGTVIGVQLAHAGRKASTWWPWAEERGYEPPSSAGWQTVGP